MLSHVIEVYFNMNKDLYRLDTVMEGLMKTIIHPDSWQPDNYAANLMWLRPGD